MNKRILKMVENFRNGRITVRRDQLKKAVEENAFDYMIVRGYDEVYDVEPYRTEAIIENIDDYWFRGANIWASIENNMLKVTMSYGYSSKYLYVSLEENKEEVKVKTIETIENSSNAEGIEVVYNKDKNGIEITFASKELATEEIRTELKSVGFRYFFKLNKWIAKQNDETIATVNKLFGSALEVEEIDVIEEVEEMLQEETTTKPFTAEEMEITNNIVNTIVEMDWTLNSIFIDKNDNCIYGNITNRYGVDKVEGLYAPSYDLHELQGVYKCLNSKIVNTSLPKGMEIIEEESTLKESDLVIHIEGEGSVEEITTSNITKATENLNKRIMVEYNETCGGYSKIFITLTYKEKNYKFRYDIDNRMNLQANILAFMLDEEYKYTLDNIEKFTWIDEENYKKEMNQVIELLSDLLEYNGEEIEINNNPYSEAIEKIIDGQLYNISASHDWILKDSRLIKNEYFNGLVLATGKAIKEFIEEGKRIDVFNLKAYTGNLEAFKEGLKKVDSGNLVTLFPTAEDLEMRKIKMLPRLERELQRVS